VVVPVREGATGDGDEVGLRRAGKRLAIADLPRVAQNRIHAAWREAGADRTTVFAAEC